MSGYSVIDIETSDNSPWWDKNNKLVLVGYTKSDTQRIEQLYPYRTIAFYTSPTMFVGHNIKYDLLFLRREQPDDLNKWLRTGKIWDTALVHHILSGQEDKFPSLDYVSGKYGLPLKDDRIKKMWEAGMKSEDIPKEMLLEYNQQDIENTHEIFKRQLLEVNQRGLMPLIQTQMDDLLSTIEMEWNGMMVDKWFLEAKTLEGNLKLDEIEKEVVELVKSDFDPIPFNINSGDHLGCYLFGGSLKYKVHVATTEKYKTGPRAGMYKQKIQELEKRFLGIALPGTRTPTGKWCVDDENLNRALASATVFASVAPFNTVVEVIIRVLAYRALSKDIKTYYEGYQKHIAPDNCIHPHLQHTSTGTGRLSCTSPNLQNTTRSED